MTKRSASSRKELLSGLAGEIRKLSGGIRRLRLETERLIAAVNEAEQREAAKPVKRTRRPS